MKETLKNYWIFYAIKKNYFLFLCMYKMVLNITKETWGNCGIKTVKYYNKKEDIIELWQKMSDIERQIKHSNIADDVLKRIRKYCGKKTKDYRRRKAKI